MRERSQEPGAGSQKPEFEPNNYNRPLGFKHRSYSGFRLLASGFYFP